MSIGPINQNPSANAASNTGPLSSSPQVSNRPQSVLAQAADSLEELSILLSNRKYKDKKLDKRTGKSKAEQAAEIAKRIQQIQKAAEIFGDTYPDLLKNQKLAKQLLGYTGRDDDFKRDYPTEHSWQEALQEKYNDRFAKLLNQAITNPNANDFRQTIENDNTYFPDISHKKGIMDAISNHIAGEIGQDNDAFQSITGALTSLLSDPKVKSEAVAGENTTKVIYETIEANREKLGDDVDIVGVGSFREFYRDNVKEPGSAVLVFSAMEREFGERQFPTFETVMDIMVASLGRDLNAHDSSIEKAELENIMNGLQNVKAVMYIFEDISALLTKVHDSFGMDHKPTKKDTLAVMRSLVPLLEKGHITEQDIETIPKEAGIIGLQASIYFLTGLSELIRKVPVGRFSNEQTKESLRMATQKALDNVIERELEEEAEWED